MAKVAYFYRVRIKTEAEFPLNEHIEEFSSALIYELPDNSIVDYEELEKSIHEDVKSKCFFGTNAIKDIDILELSKL